MNKWINKWLKWLHPLLLESICSLSGWPASFKVCVHARSSVKYGAALAGSGAVDVLRPPHATYSRCGWQSSMTTWITRQDPSCCTGWAVSITGEGGGEQCGQSPRVLFSHDGWQQTQTAQLVDAFSASFECFYESRESELNIKHRRPVGAVNSHVCQAHVGCRATRRTDRRTDGRAGSQPF